jgi:hypothetical protein
MMVQRGLVRQNLLLLAFLIATLLLFNGCGNSSIRQRIDPPDISDDLQAHLEDWLDENGRNPDTYIAAQFAEHDVVILAEQHRIKHDVEFVASLLAPLHMSGVHTFATEFARRSDQPLLDSLMVAPAWDESVAREIQFRQFMAWGYQEYVDILHAAWQVNHDRAEDTPILRVLGLNNTMDFSHFKTEADWQDDDVWTRVLAGQTEADWAAPIFDAVADSAKVLVHCGIHHGFTAYRQPVVDNGTFVRFGRGRMGNVLRDSLDLGVVTVYLHAPWNTSAGYNADFIHPAGGWLDAYMIAREDGPFSVGFDTDQSPFASLPITNTVYAHGYDFFTIADFCDGWIYTKPVSEYEPVTYIDNWINDSNVDLAKSSAMNPQWRTLDVEELNNGCLSYQQDFERFFGYLK